MLERRRFIRIPESTQIAYKIIPEVKTRDYLTKDISQGGIRFFAHEFIPRDNLLKVRLTLDKVSFSFEAFVQAVWIKEDIRNERFEIGAEFTNIPKESTDRLVGYIKYILESNINR